MGINEEIAKAFGAHGAWKTRIAQAIDSGQSEHKPEDVAVDNRCAFGKWLYDPALPASVRTSEEYQTVVRLHADFHKAAGSTLSKALHGDHGGARSELTGGNFFRAAEALASAMVRWQRNAATECSGYRSRSWRAICFFWKGRVAFRIWAAIAVPAVAAIATVGAFDAQLSATANGAGRMEQATLLLTEAAATVHEMQKERGISAAAATKGDERLSARRRDQLAVTDRSRRALETLVGPILPSLPADVRDRWQIAVEELQKIDALRSRIDAGGEEPMKIVSTYTSAIDKLIRLEESAQVLAVKPDVARAITGLLRISRAKEAAGQERATGAAAIVSGTVSPAARKRLMELSIDQAVRFSAFSDGATSAQRQVLAQALADPAVIQFEKARSALQDGEIAGLSAEGWFNVATTRIDRLHQVEDHIVTEIRETASARKAEAWRDLTLFTGLTVAAMIGGGLLVFLLTRGITQPINRLTAAMRQLASGQSRLDIPATERSDEIGEMGRAVLVFQ
ncbi:MAG: HAMP domain-containing protein, partial [Rhodospirillales bacterium]